MASDYFPTDLYRSKRNDEFPTPQDFFDELDAEFHFDLDPCSTDENAKCERHFTREQDGLKQEWTGRVWMNPPYGRECGKWVKKAFESVYGGGTAELVVCLLPARTGSPWFHDYCLKGEVRFVRGRLKFDGTPYNAPFDVMVIVFRKGDKHGLRTADKADSDG